MAIPTRAAIATYGPLSGSTWTVGGNADLFAIPAVSSATTIYDLYVTPNASINTTLGPLQDAVHSDNVIQSLGNISILFNSAVTVNLTGLSINFNLYRAGSVIGGGAFAGWGATGNTPAFVAHVPVVVPFLTANTALVTSGNRAVSSTNALLPLQPNDVIGVTFVTPGSFTAIGGISLDIN